MIIYSFFTKEHTFVQSMLFSHFTCALKKPSLWSFLHISQGWTVSWYKSQYQTLEVPVKTQYRYSQYWAQNLIVQVPVFFNTLQHRENSWYRLPRNQIFAFSNEALILTTNIKMDQNEFQIHFQTFHINYSPRAKNLEASESKCNHHRNGSQLTLVHSGGYCLIATTASTLHYVGLHILPISVNTNLLQQKGKVPVGHIKQKSTKEEQLSYVAVVTFGTKYFSFGGVSAS